LAQSAWTLASIVRQARHAVQLNEHLEHAVGLTVAQHA
jgi:hypothetical protein